MSTTAPTLAELQQAAGVGCTNDTLRMLHGAAGDGKDATPGDNREDVASDVIVVKRHPDRHNEASQNRAYTQQYNRNCFYQFRNLCDTRQSFFGVNDDGESVPAAEKPTR